MRLERGKICAFEDSLSAARTAAQAGCHTVRICWKETELCLTDQKEAMSSYWQKENYRI